MNNKKWKFEVTEQMLVIVNRDWSRTYVASIHTQLSHDGDKIYSAKCDLRNSSIVCFASDKNQLSNKMDELATLIEDRISLQVPENNPVIGGSQCSMN